MSNLPLGLSRRSAIFAAGGAALALVGGGAAWRVMRLPESAYRPWAETGKARGDVRLEVLSFAILAPNPHNRQPWQIRLVGSDKVEISCDLDRRLPETDPFDRQITIGLGGFLELARMAAAERGIRLDIAAFPDGEPELRLDKRLIARLIFTADSTVQKDPLFAQVLNRRSSKVPYDMMRPVAGNQLEQVGRVAGNGTVFSHTNATDKVAALNKLGKDAATLEFTTPHTWMETVRLMRIGASEVDQTPDGVGISGPIIEALKMTGQISREQMADPSSTAYKTGFERYLKRFDATPAFIWQVTSSNTRKDQIAAGRDWVRANLKATELGLSVNPVSQALQEFKEMATLFKTAHTMLGVNTGGGINEPRVQMLGRIGYGPVVKATHRWPLEAKLTRA
ncbi:MAG: Acg family FMN-binding oxidoreductase [Beijerinckiaceae bacterium]